MQKGLSTTIALLLGLTTLFFLGCSGGGGGGGSGTRSQTAHVRIILGEFSDGRSTAIPQQPDTFQARQEPSIFSALKNLRIIDSAWAAPGDTTTSIPASVKGFRIRVTGPGIEPAFVTDVASTVPAVDLEINAGDNRTFTGQALNAAGTPIFEGTKGGVNLVAGSQVTIEIELIVIPEVRTAVSTTTTTTSTGATQVTASVPTGTLVVEIQAGSLPPGSTVSVSVVDNVKEPPPGGVGLVLELTLSVSATLPPDKPLTVEFPYVVPPGVPEESLALYRFNDTVVPGVWEAVPGQQIDTERDVIIVNLTSLSLFGIGQNTAPIATAQSVTTAQGKAVAITLSGSDVEGVTLGCGIDTTPTHGTLDLTGCTATYTPAPGFSGSDSFTFVVNDGVVDSLPATVSLTVLLVNQPPVADALTASTFRNTPVAVSLSGSDLDGNPLTFRIIDPPTNGVLSGVAPLVLYTPAAGFIGSDSFTFVVNDGSEDSPSATVNIIVANRPPVANAGPDQGVNENTPVTLDGSGSSDPDAGDTLSFSWAQTGGPAVSLTGATTATPTFTAPEVGQEGAVLNFTLTVSDGVASATDSVDVTVRDVTAGGTIQGIVSDSHTGAGIAGATVAVLAGDRIISDVTKNEEGQVGNYQLRGIPPQDVPGFPYTVTVTNAVGYPTSFAVAPLLRGPEDPPTGPVLDLDIELHLASANITGTVLTVGTSLPIDNAEIIVRPLPIDGVVPFVVSTAAAFSGSDGVFILGGVPRDASYTVQVQAAGFVPQTLPGQFVPPEDGLLLPPVLLLPSGEQPGQDRDGPAVVSASISPGQVVPVAALAFDLAVRFDQAIDPASIGGVRLRQLGFVEALARKVANSIPEADVPIVPNVSEDGRTLTLGLGGVPLGQGMRFEIAELATITDLNGNIYDGLLRNGTADLTGGSGAILFSSAADTEILGLQGPPSQVPETAENGDPTRNRLVIDWSAVTPACDHVLAPEQCPRGYRVWVRLPGELLFSLLSETGLSDTPPTAFAATLDQVDLALGGPGRLANLTWDDGLTVQVGVSIINANGREGFISAFVQARDNTPPRLNSRQTALVDLDGEPPPEGFDPALTLNTIPGLGGSLLIPPVKLPRNNDEGAVFSLSASFDLVASEDLREESVNTGTVTIVQGFVPGVTPPVLTNADDASVIGAQLLRPNPEFGPTQPRIIRITVDDVFALDTGDILQLGEVFNEAGNPGTISLTLRDTLRLSWSRRSQEDHPSRTPCSCCSARRSIRPPPAMRSLTDWLAWEAR